MTHILDFEFGQLRFEKNIVIGIMNEGLHIDPDKNNVLLLACRDYFKNSSYGYISYRLNSYSVDPTVYINAAKEIGLEAIAVVAKNSLNESNVLIERQFFSQPFESFATLEDAKNWLSNVLIN